MVKDYFKVVVAYMIAGVVVLILSSYAEHWHPVWVVAYADLVGTLVIFGFSLYHDNSSFYDPYWSVAPILIGFYWLYTKTPSTEGQIRQVIVMALLLIWALRLTLNWGVRWQGDRHEDWRYQAIREGYPKTYWLISFFGIHLIPTLLVFLGCLALFPILVVPSREITGLDLVAILVTGFAIWIEARADLEITRVMKPGKNTHELVQSGVWSWSRHPNYLGECLFWWGLYTFALASNPHYWWVGIGPVSITILCVTISIPMIEKRMIKRRPEYSAYRESTPVLIPWPWKRKY